MKRVLWAGGLLTLTTALGACSSQEAGGGGGAAGSGGSAGTAGAGAAAGAAGTGGSAGTAGTGGAASFSVTVFDQVRINSHADQENFQNALGALELPAGPYEDARLIIELGTTCYPFESWLGAGATNPPPPGENWPADCDAYDRNFEFVLNPPEAPGDGPGIELVRAITPFGGPMNLSIDITDVVNGVGAGTHRLKTHIATWSDGAGQVSGSNGGWLVSARVELKPGRAPRQVLGVIPLYDGSHGAESPAPIDFVVPEGTTHTRLEYRATGHGGVYPSPGCSQPGEEFCPRDHRVFADGEQFQRFQPWRNDCAQLCTRSTYTAGGGSLEYCAENPCGAIQSVEAPRAGWCPGSVTPPLTWERPEFTPGEHQFSWTVTPVADGGSWRISAVLFAFGAER